MVLTPDYIVHLSLKESPYILAGEKLPYRITYIDTMDKRLHSIRKKIDKETLKLIDNYKEPKERHFTITQQFDNKMKEINAHSIERELDEEFRQCLN